MQSSPLEVRFSTDVYDIETVKRAAYRFTATYSFNFKIGEKDITCEITPLNNDAKSVDVLNDFRNEVLDQDLRRTIAKETEAARNVILAHVFSKTGLQNIE